MRRHGAFYYGIVLYGWVCLAGGYIFYWLLKLIWWLLKGLWFLLAVLPSRGIRKIRQSIHDCRLERAEDRMSRYMDNK